MVYRIWEEHTAGYQFDFFSVVEVKEDYPCKRRRQLTVDYHTGGGSTEPGTAGGRPGRGGDGIMRLNLIPSQEHHLGMYQCILFVSVSHTTNTHNNQIIMLKPVVPPLSSLHTTHVPEWKKSCNTVVLKPVPRYHLSCI